MLGHHGYVSSDVARGDGSVLETERLRLRRWNVSDAVWQYRLWTERDPRVPAHRRISADGHPTVEGLEERIRREQPPHTLGLRPWCATTWQRRSATAV